MKRIDKRSCRRFADPGWRMNLNHGLLIADQVRYIIRTSVKIIGHQRLLILYVYSREEAAKGRFFPKWTVFQSRKDYTTLERREDGSFKWRTATFKNLGIDYRFIRQCAFYSLKDEKRVLTFFRSEEDGFQALVRAQKQLLEQRCRKRQCKRERGIISRMKNLPPLPKGVKPWVLKNIVPAYFFYDYQKGKKRQKGVCSACGKEIVLENVKHNAEGACPCCKHKLIMKARGRRGFLQDRTTCQVVQRVGPNEVLIRILKAYYYYYQEETIQRASFYENARIFVRLNENGKVEHEDFYYSYGNDILTHWKKGTRPTFYFWQENFEAEVCGHVYCNNLEKALAGTPWQYCPVRLFYEYYHEPMELAPFLMQYVKHPRLEHLVKTGFYALVSDLVYRSSYESGLDETQNRTHRILRVAAEDVPYLRNLDVPEKTLKIFREYYLLNLKDRQKLLDWQLENKVERDILKILTHITPHKMMRYLEKQSSFLYMRKTKYGPLRYKTMQDIVSEYRDYLDMCVKQDYDMKNSFVLFPLDLQKAHDKVAHRIKLKANAKMRRDFRIVYQKIMQQLDFEWNGMKIVYPSSPEDIIAEGNALHHCVGSYVDRVAKKECIILFLRLCTEITKSFYTIEVKNQKVIQVRGMKNSPATPEVQEFMDQWNRKVLQTPALPKAA